MTDKRPSYISKLDEENELAVMNEIEIKWLVEIKHADKYAVLDLEIIRNGELTHYAEIKCRGIDMTKLPDYRISLNKVSEANKRMRASGLTSFIILLTINGLYFADLTSKKWDVDPHFGRDDRHDKKDRGPAAIIPWSEFRLLSKRMTIVNGRAKVNYSNAEVEQHIYTPPPTITNVDTSPTSVCATKRVLLGYFAMLDQAVKAGEDVNYQTQVANVAYAEHMLLCPKCKDQDEPTV